MLKKITHMAFALVTFIFFGINVLTSQLSCVEDKAHRFFNSVSGKTLSFKSNYNDTVMVINNGNYRLLKFKSESSSATQSKVYLKDPNRLVFDYTICSTLGLALFREPAREIRSVLMIGLGGGSLTRFIKKVYPHVHIDNVEIDPVIVDVARKYFFVKESDGFKIYVQDGRRFIETAGRKYDVVILDAFNCDDNIPFQLTSVEFLNHVKSRLSPRGAIITNLINHDQGVYESILATYRSCFKYVMRFNLDSFKMTNVIIISSNDDSKNVGREEFLSRVKVFSKFLNNEYNLRKYAVLRDGDRVKEKGVQVIHDK